MFTRKSNIFSGPSGTLHLENGKRYLYISFLSSHWPTERKVQTRKWVTTIKEKFSWRLHLITVITSFSSRPVNTLYFPPDLIVYLLLLLSVSIGYIIKDNFVNVIETTATTIFTFWRRLIWNVFGWYPVLVLSSLIIIGYRWMFV